MLLGSCLTVGRWAAVAGRCARKGSGGGLRGAGGRVGGGGVMLWAAPRRGSTPRTGSERAAAGPTARHGVGRDDTLLSGALSLCALSRAAGPPRCPRARPCALPSCFTSTRQPPVLICLLVAQRTPPPCQHPHHQLSPAPNQPSTPPASPHRPSHLTPPQAAYQAGSPRPLARNRSAIRAHPSSPTL